ncbi:MULTISPECIES: hypothetical protein [unclassified Paenibacillus]|uniref:hypothetical protein n=1 Tax=unclassified Paenibacillus TaxID=185978 RepID=UPI000CFABCFC|nr:MULTISPECIES: hypothetical protein [unclassified Paenibacillus]MBD8836551.1 hypothetical protein [Paenibacillus sp. CFBP 13594]PRA04962.1 hypothetical protein CQ043_13015 [Paenibacillus sp. MYb63]PRA47693.1 hypothetical protein CQ061_13815 [Paenibacillus sp. MYb67]QZN74839.1 hypothetical protein K5K90_26210 [Paenibacillus sp. DR312]
MNMSEMKTLETAMSYAPILMFDRNEPFYPDFVGISVLHQSGPSPSFRRDIKFPTEVVQYVIEYAIWWDYEIGHLYEMEHVWIYVGHNGEVVDCEASFHGKVLRGLLKERVNVVGHHVCLYSQPGKHAFSPLPVVFELLPNLYSAAGAEAGCDGLLVNELFQGYFETNEQIDAQVERYLKTKAFVPTMEFEEYLLKPEMFMTWDNLFDIIPHRIKERLMELDQLYNT